MVINLMNSHTDDKYRYFTVYINNISICTAFQDINSSYTYKGKYSIKIAQNAKFARRMPYICREGETTHLIQYINKLYPLEDNISLCILDKDNQPVRFKRIFEEILVILKQGDKIDSEIILTIDNVKVNK